MAHREEIECWLTDMDGVLVHENDAIPGAADLLAGWEAEGLPYLVLTNNSIFTARDLSARLRASGLHVPEERIWTSALATADFLAQQVPGGSAFVIGEAGILTLIIAYRARAIGTRGVNDYDGRLSLLAALAGFAILFFAGGAVFAILAGSAG